MFSIDTRLVYIDYWQVYDIDTKRLEILIQGSITKKFFVFILYELCFLASVIFYDFNKGDFLKVYDTNFVYYVPYYDGMENKRIYYSFSQFDKERTFETRLSFNYLFMCIEIRYYFADNSDDKSIYSSINF